MRVCVRKKGGKESIARGSSGLPIVRPDGLAQIG